MNPLFYIDWYKNSHRAAYPKGITQVWSNWTPRTTRVPGATHIVNFGLTYLCKKYFQEEFQKNFFDKPLSGILAEYRAVVASCLGITDPDVSHIEMLHTLGYLPIKIYALPEGESVALQVPPIVITNTEPDFFWLPNYFETLLSNVLWRASTSATTAQRYRKMFLHHVRRSGETDMSGVDYMGHDFSYRGMSGTEDAMLSGMGHLLSFTGTDTVPAILAARAYYGAPLSCGQSVNATEHSVMSAGTQDGEFETFERLLTEIYPTGILSIVSDTWDLWEVLTDFVPRLKEVILKRQGFTVIRPDSGDPVKILCGDPAAAHGDPAASGTFRLLAQALGVSERQGMLPLINNGRAIYGDSITVERADLILTRMIDELKLSPYNAVFGIGSYTYCYVSRDTYGWAMKATAIRKNGKVVPIFKKPVTDDGGKFSAKGILAVYNSPDGYTYTLKQEATEEELDHCAYEVVYKDGDLLIDPSFEAIRMRVRAGL